MSLEGGSNEIQSMALFNAICLITSWKYFKVLFITIRCKIMWRDYYMWVHTNVLGPIGWDCSSRTSKLYCKQMDFTLL
jgi:hypothetical protein